MRENLKDMSQIAYYFGSGKAAAGYTVVYDALFSYLRDRPCKILEIGLAEGGPEVDGDKDREVSRAPSVDMWKSFFKDASVVGFDISDFSQFEDDSFVFIRGDSGSEDDLKKVVDLGVEFDIVIDDASHASFHQQMTLSALFQCVKPGGFFIIEDLNWTPSGYEMSLPNVPKTRDFLVNYVLSGKMKPNAAISENAAEELMAEIHSVLLFDEHMLNVISKDNKISGSASISIERPWRHKSALAKLFDLHFVVFLLRRLMAAFRGEEFITRENVMLAIIQKKF